MNIISIQDYFYVMSEVLKKIYIYIFFIKELIFIFITLTNNSNIYNKCENKNLLRNKIKLKN